MAKKIDFNSTMQDAHDAQDALDLAFDSAFDEAIAGDNGQDDSQIDPPSVQHAEPPVTPPTPPPVAPPVEPPAPTAAAPAEPPAPTAAAPAEPPAPPVAPPVGKSFDEIFASFPTIDPETMQDLELDYPTVAEFVKKSQENEKSKFQALYTAIREDVLAQLGPLQTAVAPLAANFAQSEEEKFLGTITAVHSDATALLPELEKWITTLPRHRQVGANFVLDRGTAQDVVELYSEFKKSTGRPVGTGSNRQPQSNSDVEKRLRKLEVVRTQRTDTNEPDDADDFDAAFATAVKSNVA